MSPNNLHPSILPLGEHPTVQCAQIALCMKRLGDRYAKLTTPIDPYQYKALPVSSLVVSRLREWFEDRMEYLQDEYRKAAADGYRDGKIVFPTAEERENG